MLLDILILGAAVAAGFGLGRVKNAGKLAAVKTALTKAETSTIAEVKALIADIKAKL